MNVLFEYDKIYEKGEREGAIKELEKIKAIYIKLSDENVKNHSKSDYYIGKTTAYAVAISTIDERIEKLRGE